MELFKAHSRTTCQYSLFRRIFNETLGHLGITLSLNNHHAIILISSNSRLICSGWLKRKEPWLHCQLCVSEAVYVVLFLEFNDSLSFLIASNQNGLIFYFFSKVFHPMPLITTPPHLDYTHCPWDRGDKSLKIFMRNTWERTIEMSIWETCYFQNVATSFKGGKLTSIKLSRVYHKHTHKGCISLASWMPNLKADSI